MTLTGRGAGLAAGSPTRDPADTRLDGRVVVLDPGHNGGNAAAADRIAELVDAGGFEKSCDTVGASTIGGYPEHAFNFDVALRAADLLQAQGAEVVLTRTTDTGVGPCVDERARIGNEAGADAVVSIHADGAAAADTGFHVIAPAASPDGGNDAILGESALLAQSLRSAFAAAGEPVAGYVGENGLDERADLGGLNLSRVPKVFLECANMRNATDAARVEDPVWRQRAAKGIVEGITTFLNEAS